MNESEKAILYLIYAKGIKPTTACRIVFPDLKKPYQKIYKLRRKKEYISLNEKLQKKEIAPDSLLTPFYRKLFTNESSFKLIRKVPEIAKNYQFQEKKVCPGLLISSPEEVRKEFVRIYLDSAYSNELRLKALDMLAKSLSMYSERNMSLNVNLNTELDKEKTQQLLENYLANLKRIPKKS